MLTGKLALITGSGSGIGRAVSRILSRDGAVVIATDINLKNADQTLEMLSGSKHSSAFIDVSKMDSISKVVNDIKVKYNAAPDVLVNCAGITRDDWFLNLTEEAFQQVFDVNLKGTFLVSQVVCKELMESKSKGSVINIGSIVGKAGNMGQSNYAASKAGVEAFTKSVAKEMAGFNIRCNAVIPGFIDTPMTATVPDKVKDQFKNIIPLKRFGKPEEVAEVVSFLASDKSSYITGSLIQVTGGFWM